MPMVLIVNDDSAFQKQLRTAFGQGSGFDACIEARKGAEALAKTKLRSPDLVILDFSLPDMSGLQLAEELKAITAELPIFLLTTDYNVKLEKGDAPGECARYVWNRMIQRKLGWETGIEPATFGATDRRSTS